MKLTTMLVALAASLVSAQTACTSTSVFPGTSTITAVVTSTYCPVCDEAKATGGAYVTTYETVYASVCPTGISSVKYLVSQTCTGTTPINTATPPPGYITTATVCTACPGQPTYTVTVPCESCAVTTSTVQACPTCPASPYVIVSPPAVTNTVGTAPPATYTVPASTYVCPGSPQCPATQTPGTYTAPPVTYTAPPAVTYTAPPATYTCPGSPQCPATQSTGVYTAPPSTYTAPPPGTYTAQTSGVVVTVTGPTGSSTTGGVVCPGGAGCPAGVTTTYPATSPPGSTGTTTPFLGSASSVTSGLLTVFGGCAAVFMGMLMM